MDELPRPLLPPALAVKRMLPVQLIRGLQLLGVVYLLIVLAVLLFQRRLIYFPTKIPAGVIESVAAEHGFAPWRNPAGEIIGWKMAAENATGSVLIVHGNAGCALSRDYIAGPIHQAAPVDVYVLEYPGYGARGGSPSKATWVAAAEEAFLLLPNNRPRYVVSESIGTGVAGELARRHPAEISGLAMLAPFSSLPTVAQRQMPWLPAAWLLRDRFEPAKALQSYHGPVTFAVAGADEIFGPADGRRLAGSYPGPKAVQEFAGAGHNDVASRPANWWQAVFAFWGKYSRPLNALN